MNTTSISKVRRGTESSAKKGLGKLESFKMKERQKEYDRRAKEIQQKMAQSNKEKQIAVLMKQMNELDAEFEDVLTLNKTPAKKLVRRGSAAVNKKPTAEKLQPSFATPATQVSTNYKAGEQ